MGCKKTENLLLVDFICHGVPSQDLFDKALASYEKKHNCQIEEFSFRHKLPDSVHYLEKSFEEFPFYHGFKRYCCLRESCYKCKFCVEERVSDLTIADFWRLEQIDISISKEEFNKGYSMVISNSNYGEHVLKHISSNLEIQERSIKDISALNKAYLVPTKKGFYARRFWSDYEKMEYDLLENKHLVFIPFNKLPLYKKIIRYVIWKFDL